MKIIDAELGNGPGAIIDEDYRYLLWRQWAWPETEAMQNWCLFIMLNPSTADATEDDPTIRRCVGFAGREACHGLMVVNLFAFRATDPRTLELVPDAVGPLNMDYLDAAVEQAHVVVCAWGARGNLRFRRGRDYYDNMGTDISLHLWEKRHPRMFCLGRTKAGHPKHPLYLPADAPLELFPNKPESKT